MSQKVFVVEQDSNIDGERMVVTYLRSTFEKAKKTMEELIREILTEGYFSRKDRDSYTINEGEDFFFINDDADDYYENIIIVEREVL